MSGQIALRCPAKVNLYLRVLWRRDDGYHELVTVMQPLGLADVLTVAAGGDGLALACDHPDLPVGPENLVWRAAETFAQAVGRPVKAHIRLSKRIPLAAGLGGGSSDAAATLLALNSLAGNPLDDDQLHSLASSLGADVPFFLLGAPALAFGIGADLMPMTLPPYWYVLYNPGVPLSTRWVYENLDLNGSKGLPWHENWAPEHPETWVHNDLAAVALRRLPELNEVLAAMARLGAITQTVTGSGPTLFGLFASQDTALAAAKALRGGYPGWIVVTQGLTGLEDEGVGEERVWKV
jgi:4-diphosphocytidyl-2-C-methyl-D-erythritol kinase